MSHPTHPLGPWAPHYNAESRSCPRCGGLEFRGLLGGGMAQDVLLELPCGSKHPRKTSRARQREGDMDTVPVSDKAGSYPD